MTKNFSRGRRLNAAAHGREAPGFSPGRFTSGPFGKFLVPLEESDPDELTDEMVDDHQWGRSDALEPCLCFRAPTPEEEEAAFRAVRSRQKLHRLGLWPRPAPALIEPGGISPEEPDPSPAP